MSTKLVDPVQLVNGKLGTASQKGYTKTFLDPNWFRSTRFTPVKASTTIKTDTQTITQAPQVISFNLAQYEEDDSFMTFDPINNEFIIEKDAIYEIQYILTMIKISGSARQQSYTYVESNIQNAGWVEIPYTRKYGYHRNSTDGADSMFANTFQPLTAGDKLRLISYTNGTDLVTVQETGAFRIGESTRDKQLKGFRVKSKRWSVGDDERKEFVMTGKRL